MVKGFSFMSLFFEFLGLGFLVFWGVRAKGLGQAVLWSLREGLGNPTPRLQPL